MQLDVSAAGRLATVPQKLKALAWAGQIRLTWAGVASITVLAAYLLLLPLVARTWRTTGDEPHYLLAAHSLVVDGDFDLTNNYANLDYLNFYISQDITPQIRLNQAGEQILNHDPALPFLIAPAYALMGHFGVLLFQAVLGALLALFTYKLAHFISQNAAAALLATLLVAFSPPLLMYTYLVYPELSAALLTTLTLYFILTRDKPSLGVVVLVIICLALLPWFNRRFVLLALALALATAWNWRKQRTSPHVWQHATDDEIAAKMQRGEEARTRPFSSAFSLRPSALFLTGAGVSAIFVSLFSVGLLTWFYSQLQGQAHGDIVAPANAVDFWQRLLRGVGWLVDQQRGLFVFAPLYILAAWGIPPLVSQCLRQRSRNWLVLLPFFLSLGIITLAGGFWQAWEVGPRFLVVGLPGLAVLLALAFSRYRGSKLWLALAVPLVMLSLLNSWVILQNPSLPYESSLPSYYGQKLSLPLTEALPDLAGYMRVEPQQPLAPAGASTRLIETAKLDNLPFGHYTLTWPLQIDPTLPPETELARLSIKHLGGGPVFNQTITAADVSADGLFKASFINPGFDRWNTPMLLYVTSTGQADLQAGAVLFTPVSFYALFLPYFFVLLIGAGAALFWRKVNANPLPITGIEPAKIWWLGLALLLAGSVGYLAFAQTRLSHTYDAGQMLHFVGQPMADPQAADGRAWLVDPAVDPPQKAIYGPFDFYDAGQYQVTFWLKLPQPVDPGLELARLKVAATANFDPLLSQPLKGEHFSKPDLYHQMVLTVDNPRRQALSFEVDYLGVAPLVIDGVTVARKE